MQDAQLTGKLAQYRMCPRMLLRILESALATRRAVEPLPGNHPRSCGASRLSRRLAWAACSVLVMVFLAACGAGGPKAPDFQVTLYDGTEFRLSDQAGANAVVLNFWYPSCPPCREEMPAFESAWQQVRDEEVEFLGLFVPQGFDNEQDSKDFIDELGLTYGFATDSSTLIAQSYELEYFPTTYFIDKSGRISKAWISVLDEETIVGLVRQMTES